MKLQGAYILFILTVLFGCKTSRNNSFTKSAKEKLVQLVPVKKPFVDFVLESGDTLKFNNYDISFLLETQIKDQIKSQGYLNDRTWRDNSEALKERDSDTVIYQNLSTVDNKTLSGILDVWLARELLLEGKTIIAQINHFDNPKRLRYVIVKDKLGGQQGTFYDENGKIIYRTIIAFGE